VLKGSLANGSPQKHLALIVALFLFLCPLSLSQEAETSNSTREGLLADSGIEDTAATSTHDTSSTAKFSPDRVSRSSKSNPAIMIAASETTAPNVQWKSLVNASMFYLGVMHSFRVATEQGTREGLHNSIFGGYFKALGAMHGWSDGDTYYENYLGHPIQGAVSGYIWIHNDPRYRTVQFGADRDYWMSRLRAYAFSWAFSEQFEIGLISEASIGQIQRYCCAYGFVDHVITPNGGLVWMVAEDALDRYVTIPIEKRTKSTAIRILARTALNPPQSFANLMMLQKPWHRENRTGVIDYEGQLLLRDSQSLLKAVSAGDTRVGLDVAPKFELAASVPGFQGSGNLSCIGGGAVAAVRANDFWQWTLEVSGCTFGNSLPRYWSGDSLTFTTGPQWIVHTAGRWSPHAHFRIGGQKITLEKVDPKKRQEVLAQKNSSQRPDNYRDLFTQRWESTGISFSAGGGLDFSLNRGMAFRVANLEYLHSWLGNVGGNNFSKGLRFSAGLVLRVGTW
jgi:hypothetical protein